MKILYIDKNLYAQVSLTTVKLHVYRVRLNLLIWEISTEVKFILWEWFMSPLVKQLN